MIIIVFMDVVDCRILKKKIGVVDVWKYFLGSY